MQPARILPASIDWKPDVGDVVLLGAEEADLPIVETVLAGLPPKARGQVFVAVDGPDRIRPLSAPGRVCVSWLDRSRGQSLPAAIDAWLGEMLPVEAAREHRVYAWVSGEPAARARTSA